MQKEMTAWTLVIPKRGTHLHITVEAENRESSVTVLMWIAQGNARTPENKWLHGMPMTSLEVLVRLQTPLHPALTTEGPHETGNLT